MLGWVKCREHISLLVILCIIVYVTNKNIFFKPISDYGKMLKYGKNIGKPIYRSITSFCGLALTTITKGFFGFICSKTMVYFRNENHI